jgi:hypothetical protein
MSFEHVTIDAVENIIVGKMTPREAWEYAAEKNFIAGSSNIDKGCPKNAFLGLREEGLVKGVPAGKYTRSDRNKQYPINAVELLKRRKVLPRAKDVWIDVLPSLGYDVNKVDKHKWMLFWHCGNLGKSLVLYLRGCTNNKLL